MGRKRRNPAALANISQGARGWRAVEDWISDVAEHIRKRDREDVSSLEIFNALAASQECSIVWAAIQKRLGEAEAIHRTKLMHWFPGADSHALERWVGTDLRHEAVNLVDTVEHTLRKPSFCDAATVSQRKNLKDRITKAARTMTDALRLLERDDSWADEVDSRLSERAREAATRACDILAERDSFGEIRFVIDGEARTIAEFVALACLDDPITLIEMIRDGVQDWANTVPLIPRPEAANARRLRLIRVLSDYFRRRYGTPLRSCVLAVCGVFFDCEGLDESTIAKLAP